MNRLGFFRMFFFGLVVSIVGKQVLGEDTARFAPTADTLFRRPVSMCWADQGEKILVTNRRAGSISVVEIVSGLISEARIGGQPEQTVWLSRNKQLVTVDGKTGEVIFASLNAEGLQILHRVVTGHRGSRLAISEDESLVAVSSIWDRSVSLILTEPDGHVEALYQLEFEPWLICFSPDSKFLIVLDAFGSHVVAIDVRKGKTVGATHLDGHNFGGVVFLSNDRFLVTHQILHSDSPTTENNIASGLVIENVFQEIQIKQTHAGTIVLEPVIIGEIGVPSHGAADPACIVVDQSRHRFIALAGVDEVAILNSLGVVSERIKVGNRPVDLLLSKDKQRLYCLNNLSETISVIDIQNRNVLETISLGGTPSSTTRERGEELFFDGHLSRFGWYSCHSCHRNGHTNGLLADTFGDGTSGAPKRVPSLLGGRDNNPWAWNGSMRSLHDQVQQSGRTTMRGRGFTARETNDMVAFLHTLEQPPAFRPAVNNKDRKLIDQGRKVFNSAGCARCHVPPLTYTSDAKFNVGISDEHGQKLFNPPSLNGVGYRRRFFHDGRVGKLRDVFIEYGHELNDALNDDELDALIRFLQSL